MFTERAAQRKKPTITSPFSELRSHRLRLPLPDAVGGQRGILGLFAQQRQRCDRLILIAGSIGAFFSMSVLDETLVDRAYFISPVVDMENLIGNMMRWANVTEQELAEKKEIATDFGETLSWRYLCYVRAHPISWNVPTQILYGEHDNLTSMETVSAFAKRHHAKLTVMPGGEHWFHTEEQMQFLDHWLKKRKRRLCR